MNKHLRTIYLFLLLVGLSIHVSKAQSDENSSDDALKSQAIKFFTEDKFEDAFPLYSQLVSLYPKDPDYNYRLGVCMLFASDDKERPIPFLEFASRNKNVEKEVLYYLGKAYHLNYRFDDAIAAYFSYKKVASGANAQRLTVDRQIEMCKNGKQLLRKLSELVVMDKKEMGKEDFFRSYDVSGIGGKLLVKPDEKEFKTSLDKKKNDNSIVYLASDNNQIYFASYGSSDKHGKDIFLVKKLPNGNWSKPQNLGPPVNTDYDEDFPFLHPNGKALYFCSKGHNSMGGYDIFKSILNEESNTWNEAVNLDFPINTPDDDILYVTDQNEKEAYFSSSRSSIAGKTAVYHINVERKPIEFAIIKGQFIKNRDGQAPDVKITVKDMNDNTILGIYNSNPETGIYLINLPNGGRFLYTIESIGFATQSESVVIPEQFEFKPMKQEISYELKTGKLLVKNIFDEVIDDSNYLLALKYIKEKSKLEVPLVDLTSNNENSQVDSSSVANASQASATITTKLTNDDIVKIAYNDANEATNEAKILKEQADFALLYANKKNELAQNKTKEAAKLMVDASVTNDNVKKQELIDSSTELNKEAEQLNQETVAAFNLGKKMEMNAEAKKEEADLSQQYAADLEAAVKSKDSKDALAKLEAQGKKLEELSQKNLNSNSVTNSLKMDIDNKEKELDVAIQTSQDLLTEIAGDETAITNLSTDLENTTNEELKIGIHKQIDGLNDEIEEKQKQVTQNIAVIDKKRKELDGIKNENELVGSIIDQSKTGASEMTTATVASIDKNKLEEQVNNIKNADSNTSPVVNAATSNKSDASGNATITKDNNAETVVINQKYTSELDNAEKIGDEAEREKVKSDIYNKWSEEVTADVKKKKQQLTTLTDADFKAALSKQIEDEEQLVKEKQTQSDVSLAKLENITQKAAYSAKNPVVASNETTSSDAGSNTTENNESSAGINQKFGDDLAATEKISNEVDREKAKADVLKSWSDAITTDLAKKKQQLTTLTDTDFKTALTKQIDEEEQLLKEKQTQSDVSLAKVETLKQQNAITSTNETPATNKGYEKFDSNLADAEKITDATEREKTKSGLYLMWSQAIDANVTKQKQLLATTTDPDQKAAIEKSIADEESLSADKQTQSDISLAKVETIKQQNAIDTNTSVPVNNESSTASSSNSANAETLAVTNQKFTDDLTASEKISDEAEREKMKAEILKNWSAEINSDITKKKEQLISLTDTDFKAALSKQIDDEEKLAKDKQAQADVSLAKVETIKQQSALSANNTVPISDESNKNESANTTTAKTSNFNQKFNDDLAAIESIGNEADREKAKAVILTNWSDSLNYDVAKKKQEYVAATNQETKNWLTQQINEGQQLADEKQSQANESVLKAQSLNGEVAVVTNNSATENKTANNNNSGTEKEFSYTTNESKGEIEKANAITKQSEDLITQSQEIKIKANEQTDPVAKSQLIDQSEELIKQASEKKLESFKLISAVNNKEYSANQVYLDQYEKSIINNMADDISMAEMMNDEGRIYYTKGEKLRIQADTAASNSEKEGFAEDAYNAEIIALLKQNRSLDLYKKYSTSNGLAVYNPTPINNSANLNTSNAVVSDNTTPKSNTTGNPDNTSLALTNSSSTNDSINKNDVNNTTKNAVSSVDTTGIALGNPVLSTNTSENISNTSFTLEPSDLFERKPTTVYSEAKPIPVNEKLPEGLIFKVQIGAFRKPIPQDLFQGMTPITGETTPQGYIRYTAGLFLKFTTADNVKKEIRNMGYKDAFVVAFMNGKRIAINEALGLTASDNNSTLSQTNPATSTPIVNNNGQESNNTVPLASNNQSAASGNSETGIAETQSISVVGGLFYTIQVGVFSKPVSSDKLFNVQPLYTETAPNGNLRYNVGVYNNIPRANEAKSMILDVGIKDAYVTAYYNGKRISLPEARQVETQGIPVYSTSGNINVLPKFIASPNNNASVNTNAGLAPTTDQPEASTQPNTVNAAKTLINTINQNNAAPSDSGLIFKVQIGAFRNEIPLEVANKFISIAEKGIKNFKDENGLTVYTVGNYKTYTEADKIKIEIASAGVNDAFIVAYNNGKRISIDEAEALKNK